MQRTLLILAILSMSTPLVAALPSEVRMPDGITALISPKASLADQYIFRNANGDFEFDVSIFKTDGTEWSQVAQVATLRVISYEANTEEWDAYSQRITTDADEPIHVTVPGVVARVGRPMDVFVTFSTVAGYPTSHHSPQKNALIEAGQYDAADVFDYHHGFFPIAG